MTEMTMIEALRLAMDEAEAKQHAMVMLTVQTMNYVHAGHYRVAL